MIRLNRTFEQAGSHAEQKNARPNFDLTRGLFRFNFKPPQQPPLADN